MSQSDLAKALRHEVQWVKRRESGEYDAEPDLAAIAHATKVPLSFLEEGWQVLEGAGEPSLAEKVEALDHQLKTVRDRLDNLYDIAITRVVAPDQNAGLRAPGEDSGTEGTAGPAD